MHATPFAQQAGPHGVWPLSQQQLNDGLEHVPLQHFEPQTLVPAGQATASPRKGLSTVAAAAAPSAAPIILRTPRRGIDDPATSRENLSKRSATISVPPLSPPPGVLQP
jgi:hypothetical protein